jgi:hypothetical protein
MTVIAAIVDRSRSRADGRESRFLSQRGFALPPAIQNESEVPRDMHYRHTRANALKPARGEAQLSWTIWWDMHRRPGSEGWSRAVESSEEDALQRAERFLKLGFVVYAIKDPKGAVFMDEAQIAGHFAARAQLAAASGGPRKALR